jgi:hypothetical protein
MEPKITQRGVARQYAAKKAFIANHENAKADYHSRVRATRIRI